MCDLCPTEAIVSFKHEGNIANYCQKHARETWTRDRFLLKGLVVVSPPIRPSTKPRAKESAMAQQTGNVLVVDAGKTPPEDLLELFKSKFDSFRAFAVPIDGEVTDIGDDGDKLNLSDFFKDKDYLNYNRVGYGMKHDQEVLPEDKQPFLVLEDGENKPVLVAFIEGVFPTYENGARELASDFLTETCSKLYDQCDHDLGKLCEALDAEAFKKDARRLMGRGSIVFVAGNGEIVMVTKNDDARAREFKDWGWIANVMDYTGEATEVKPAPKAAEPTAMSAKDKLRAKLAAQATGTQPSVPQVAGTKETPAAEAPKSEAALAVERLLQIATGEKRYFPEAKYKNDPKEKAKFYNKNWIAGCPPELMAIIAKHGELGPGVPFDELRPNSQYRKIPLAEAQAALRPVAADAMTKPVVSPELNLMGPDLKKKLATEFFPTAEFATIDAIKKRAQDWKGKNFFDQTDYAVNDFLRWDDSTRKRFCTNPHMHYAVYIALSTLAYALIETVPELLQPEEKPQPMSAREKLRASAGI